jgi:SrtB family sortase
LKRWCLLTLVLLLDSCGGVPEQPVSEPVSAFSSLPDYSAEQPSEPSSEIASSEETVDPRLAELAALHEQNNDLAGWITISDTGIDFPVMQRDNSFYLTHGFDGKWDKDGLPFMDSRCLLREGMFSVNTLIYGHNMDGQVFRDLTFYRELDYYKEHPFVTFDTIHDLGQWVVFACFEANTEPRFGPVFEYYNFINDHDPKQIQWYLDEVKSRSFFLSPVEVNAEDILLTLQTCANDRYETKVCVAARKLREDEMLDSFDFESAEENLDRLKAR